MAVGIQEHLRPVIQRLDLINATLETEFAASSDRINRLEAVVNDIMTNVNRLCILFGAESDPALFDDEDEELAPSGEQVNNSDRPPSPARPVG